MQAQDFIRTNCTNLLIAVISLFHGKGLIEAKVENGKPVAQ